VLIHAELPLGKRGKLLGWITLGPVCRLPCLAQNRHSRGSKKKKQHPFAFIMVQSEGDL